MVALKIALRYLFSRKSHNVVNIISVISMAGVAVATIAIICVLSVFNGFSTLAFSRLSVIDPEIKILPASGKVIASADSLVQAIAMLDEVDIVLPTINEQALAVFDNRQMSINLMAIAEGYNRVSDIENTVIDGEFLNGYGYDEERVGAASVGTAIKTGVRAGYTEPMAIYVPRRTGRINQANPMSGLMADSVRITAVYQVDENDHDANTVIVDLAMARRLLEYTTEASAIEVRSKSGRTDEAIKAIKTLLNDNTGQRYVVKNRLEQEERSMRMIAIEKWITFVMLGLILIIASFNVVSTLSMLIIEKRSNMSTLRALGAGHGMIRSIFVWEGWLISLIGGISGMFIGILLCVAQQYGGFIKLSGEKSQLSITAYPVELQPGDVVGVLGLVVLTGLFISIIASRFASENELR